jgi:DNA-binding protein H-NS
MAHRSDSETLWQRWIEAGEEKLGQIAEELLANPRVTEAFGAALSRAAQTKGKVDRNLQLLLGALNLPTRQDFNKLSNKVETLQGSLVNLNIKLDRLLAGIEAKKRSAPARAAKPRRVPPEVGTGG